MADDNYQGSPDGLLPAMSSPNQIGFGPPAWIQAQQYQQQMGDYTKQQALAQTMRELAVQKAQSQFQDYTANRPHALSALNATNDATTASIGLKSLGEAQQQQALGATAMAGQPSAQAAAIAANVAKAGEAGNQQLDNSVAFAARINAIGNDPSLAARIPQIAQSMGIPANSPIVQGMQTDPQGTTQHLTQAQQIVKAKGGQASAPSYADTVSQYDVGYQQKKTLEAQQQAADLKRGVAVAGIGAGAQVNVANLDNASREKIMRDQIENTKTWDNEVLQSSRALEEARAAGKDTKTLEAHLQWAQQSSLQSKQLAIQTQQAITASLLGKTIDSNASPVQYPNAGMNRDQPAKPDLKSLPQVNQKGWVLHVDAAGNGAYVNPKNAQQYEEVK